MVVKMWSNGHQKRDPICVTFDVSLFALLYGWKLTSAMSSQALSVNHLQSTSTALLFHLSHPPHFEIIASDRRTRTQVAHLDEQHRRVAPFTSTLLRIDFRSAYERNEALKKMLEIQVTRPIASKITVVTGAHSRYSEAAIRSIGDWLASLDVCVAFQLEALLYGNLLDYSQLSRLKGDIVGVVQSKGTAAAERILILFSARVEELVRGNEECGEKRRVGARAVGLEKPPAQAGVKRRVDLVLDDSSEGESDSDDASSDEDEEGIFDKLHRDLGPGLHPPLAVSDLERLLVEAAADQEAARSPFTRLDQAVLSRHVTITPTRFILKGELSTPRSRKSRGNICRRSASRR